MRVQVGPLPSAGAGLWIAYARTVISQALVRPGDLGVEIDPSVAELFETYLDTWDRLAAHSATFEWTADIPASQVQLMGTTWLMIASGLADSAERRGYPISPPEGDEFYRALIGGLLDGLADEGGELADLAAELRGQWPGLKAEDP